MKGARGRQVAGGEEMFEAGSRRASVVGGGGEYGLSLIAGGFSGRNFQIE